MLGAVPLRDRQRSNGLLALTLKPDEYVLIGNDIKVINIGGSTVRLGVEAPLELDIDRAIVRQAKLAVKGVEA